jgi:hypothetical protein
MNSDDGTCRCWALAEAPRWVLAEAPLKRRERYWHRRRGRSRRSRSSSSTSRRIHRGPRRGTSATPSRNWQPWLRTHRSSTPSRRTPSSGRSGFESSSAQECGAVLLGHIEAFHEVTSRQFESSHVGRRSSSRRTSRAPTCTTRSSPKSTDTASLRATTTLRLGLKAAPLLWGRFRDRSAQTPAISRAGFQDRLQCT